MTRYFAKIKGWPIEIDAASLLSLKRLAIQIAEENDIKSIELVNLVKNVKITKKLKNIKIRLK